SWYTRFDRWCSRRYSHGRSTGSSSGEYGGSRIGVGFGGARSFLATWYPAPSHTGNACPPTGVVAGDWSRNVCTTPASSLGDTSPSARPLTGHTAPGTCRFAYAVRSGAVGRGPFPARVRVSDPFWPNRASSSNHTSTGSPGWARAASATRPG